MLNFFLIINLLFSFVISHQQINKFYGPFFYSKNDDSLYKETKNTSFNSNNLFTFNSPDNSDKINFYKFSKSQLPSINNDYLDNNFYSLNSHQSSINFSISENTISSLKPRSILENLNLEPEISFQYNLPSKILLSNNTGLNLRCPAIGDPIPAIIWQKEAGVSKIDSEQTIEVIDTFSRATNLINLPLVYHDLSNSALVFRSFAIDEYNTEIHSASYRCLATNLHGTIISTPVQIKAVTNQQFKIDVQDEYVVLHSTAVFQCIIPSQHKEQLKVLNWLEEPGGRIFNVPSNNSNKFESYSISFSPIESLINGSQYLVLPSGELYINNVDMSFSKKSYRCKVKNLITGELIASNTEGRLIITESQTRSRLRITHYEPKIKARLNFLTENDENDFTPKQNIYQSVKNDDYAVLVCAAQSQPLPKYTWYRILSNGQRTPISTKNSFNLDTNDIRKTNLDYYNLVHLNKSTDNTRQKESYSYNMDKIDSLSSKKYIQWVGILFIRHFNIEDEGLYTCVVNNTYEEERLDIQFTVQVPLRIKITPSKENIDIGKSTQFNCTVKGHPQPKISWRLNGKKQLNHISQLYSSNSYSKAETISSNFLYHKDYLSLTRANKEQKGMYQCFASNEFEQTQATAQLSLGIDSPYFHEKFDSQTLNPGQSLSIKCSASGSPLPQITWSLDGSPLSESNHVRFGDYVTKNSITISYVNISELIVQDGGLYRCTADNNYAKVQHERPIFVLGDPVARPTTKITIIQGETLVKNCPIAGHPIDQISWYKGEIKIPSNHRQKVNNNGTLEISQVEKCNDEGSYTCKAKNQRGKTAEATFFLNVTIKPTIEHFEFTKSLREGQRASVTCTVSSGDLPIRIEWLKENDLIDSSNDKISINSHSAYSSTLLFNSLSLEQKGNYTCIASNNAGMVSYSAIMHVNVAPKWIIEPNVENSVVRGKSLLIDCQAEGFPIPRIRWTKADGNSPKDFKPIVSNPHLQVYENGSLTFVDARDLDEGYYLCQATNNIGSGLSKVVKININVSAHFKTKFTVVTKKKEENVQLKCESFGDKPINIIWSKDKQRIETKNSRIESIRTNHVLSNNLQMAYFLNNQLGSEPTLLDSSRYEIIDNFTENGLISYLEIVKAERIDSASFTCLTYNTHGNDYTNIQLIIQEKPEPPKDLSLVESSSRSIKIEWSVPFSGNLPILGYLLQYSEEQFFIDNEKSNLIEDETSKLVYNISIKNNECFAQLVQLKPSKKYYVRIFAENNLGFSESSQIISVNTDEDLPTGAPNKLKAIVVSSKQVKISWKPPDTQTHNGQLKGYYVGYKLLNNNNKNKGQFVYKTLKINDKFTEQVVLSNLQKHSKYVIIVQAFNDKGAGPNSEEIQVMTAELDPPETPQIHVASTSTSSIHLTWQPLFNDENPIDGYLLFVREENFLEWRENSLDAQQTFYKALDLKCGTRYQFYLIAYNKQGRGEQSETITVKTEGGLPVAPDKKSALSVNISCVAVKLDAWHHGGCTITGFRIRYKLHGSKDWTQIKTDHIRFSHQSNNYQQNNLAASNAQQLSVSNTQSNSISMVGNNYYSISKNDFLTGQPLPSVINISDLQPGRKYLIQVSAMNQVGSTDAEYNVATYSMITNELMRSSNKLLQHGQHLSAHLADYTYLLPICLSVMVITILFLMVCVVVKRGNQIPNASTSLLYGTANGRKDEQLQMTNFTLSNKHKQIKACDLNSVNSNGLTNCDNLSHLLITTNNGAVCETIPNLNNGNLSNILNNNQIDNGGMEPLYATVKRTPRAIRNSIDPHIYSYPLQSINTNLATVNTLNKLNAINALNNINNGLTNLNGINNLNSCNNSIGNNLDGCSINCNQNLLENSCNILSQCLDENTVNKLYGCSKNEFVNNTSFNEDQILNNCNTNKTIMYTEDDQLIENKFLELGLCKIMR